MVNAVDRRLAAAHHLRQIEAMVRLERVVEQVDAILDAAFVSTYTNRARAIAGDNGGVTRPAFFRKAVPVLVSAVDAAFVDFAKWSYATAVSSIAVAVPRNYFKTISPRLAMFESQGLFDFLSDDEDEDEDEDVGLVPFLRQLIGEFVAVDVFTEPIALGEVKDLSDDQWNRVLDSIVFPPPTPERSRELVEAKDESGRGFRERLEILTRKADDADEVAEAIAEGFADGENLAEMRKRVLPLVGGIKSSAKRVVRTEGLRIAERLQRETWGPFGDTLKAVQILAVLDENTRSHHVLRNGRLHFRVPTGDQLGLDTLPLLPDEPNCRCWSTPVLEPPPGLANNPALQAAFANADGGGIPDPATYEDWFRGVGEGRRKLAVGSRRYDTVNAAIGDREPEWADFIDPVNGKLLAISVLRKETAIDRIARKSEVNALIASRQAAIAAIARTGFLVD